MAKFTSVIMITKFNKISKKNNDSFECWTQACYLSDQISLTFIFDPEALKCIDFKESSCYGVPLHNEVNWISNHFKMHPTQ